MVDGAAQLDLIERAARGAAAPVRVCIDLDVGYRPLGGRVTIGPKRSPLHDAASARRVRRARSRARPGAEARRA